MFKPNPFVLMTSLAVFSGPAFPQGGIEEIVVTARKSEESLQSTPVAVTALSELMLDKAQVAAMVDLQRTTPNLSVGLGGSGPATLVFVAIRGQAQTSPNSAADPAVGIYIDGVYYARPTSGNVDLLDVSRAEILRGPQGTLFGRNTTGGAINIVTNQPVGEYEGWVKAEVGNFEQRKVELVSNIPIKGDELATRFAMRFSKHDGYGENETLDVPSVEVDHNFYGRASVLWDPIDQPFSVLVSGDYSDYEDSGQLVGTTAVNESLDLGGLTLGDVFAIAGFDPSPYIQSGRNYHKTYGEFGSTGRSDFDRPFSLNMAKGLSATIDWDLDAIQLKSITAYREADTENSLDLDGLPVGILTFTSMYRQRQFSQEFQISGSWGSNLDWITGAYYFREKSFERSDSQAFAIFNRPEFQALMFPMQPVTGGTRAHFDNMSKGVFAQANYQFTDRLRGTFGYRYTWDDREIVRGARGLADDPATCLVIKDVPGGPCRQTESEDFSYPAWTVGLDYQWSDALFVYAKTSAASMAGGWNIRGNFAPSFGPEDVRDIEVGFKADLFDDRLRLNVALFRSWQEDVQRIINDFDDTTNTVTQYVTNAGDAELQGAEFELTLLPWDGMEVNATLALLDGEYESGSFLEEQVVNGVPVLVDRSDEALPHAPETTYSIGMTQVLDTSVGQLSLHLDYAYMDDRVLYTSTAAEGFGPTYQQQVREANRYGIIDGYGLLNGKVSLAVADTGLTFSLWGRNLNDENYATGMGNFYTALGIVQVHTGEPRMYGASVKYEF